MDDEMLNRVHDAIQNSFNSNDINCYPIAIAAIKAMREPTEKMIEVAKTSPNNIYGPKAVWEEMINAITGDE